jgi:DNA-directed RNA polymerase subunit RPC12/RpoP
MNKYRCSDCEKIIDSPEDLSEMEHEDCSGVLLELPKVTRIDTSKLKTSHLTGLAGRIDQLVDQFGFIHMGEECDYPENEIEPYKDWGIYLDIPNGGILAVDIIHESGYWGVPTSEDFGYYHGTLIRDFAKAVIDEVERCVAEVPAQLSLFKGRDRV